jgi:hypothetical protein
MVAVDVLRPGSIGFAFASGVTCASPWYVTNGPGAGSGAYGSSVVEGGVSKMSRSLQNTLQPEGRDGFSRYRER